MPCLRALLAVLVLGGCHLLLPLQGTVDGGTPELEAGPDLDGLDAGPDLLVDPLEPPRPVAPLSGSTVTTLTPRFRWHRAHETPDPDGRTRLEICGDPSCDDVLLWNNFTGDQGVLPPNNTLKQGKMYFWRLFSCQGLVTGTRPSQTWEFFLPHQSGLPGKPNTAWGNIADINRDGLADLIVGADRENCVYLFHGDPSGQPVSAGSVVLSEPSFGEHLSATDINGDGWTDLVVGSDHAADDDGKALVYLNGQGSWPLSPTQELLGKDPQGRFGINAALGDFDGDGYGDVAISAYEAKFASNVGKVFLHRGGPAGLDPNSFVELRSSTDRGLGFSLAAAGDVNGDGYADVLIGSYGEDASYVCYGGSVPPLSGPIDSCTRCTKIVGPDSGQFGFSVGGAGDVNGDGYADVLIGALAWNTHTGRAYLYLGGSAGVQKSPASTMQGTAEEGAFGHTVSGAGDVDGDGFADVIIGQPSYLPEALERGRAFLYRGGTGGLESAPVEIGSPNPSLKLLFGLSVTGAGDLDGDGRSEVAVAAPEPKDNPPLPLPAVYIHGWPGSQLDMLGMLEGPVGSHFGVNIARTY